MDASGYADDENGDKGETGDSSSKGTKGISDAQNKDDKSKTKSKYVTKSDGKGFCGQYGPDEGQNAGDQNGKSEENKGQSITNNPNESSCDDAEGPTTPAKSEANPNSPQRGPDHSDTGRNALLETVPIVILTDSVVMSAFITIYTTKRFFTPNPMTGSREREVEDRKNSYLSSLADEEGNITMYHYSDWVPRDFGPVVKKSAFVTPERYNSGNEVIAKLALKTKYNTPMYEYTVKVKLSQVRVNNWSNYPYYTQETPHPGASDFPWRPGGGIEFRLNEAVPWINVRRLSP